MYASVAHEMLDYIEENFKGYKCYFGTTKPNRHSQEVLQSRGYTCVDDTIQMSVNKGTLLDMDCKYSIEALSEERMDAYRTFHDVHYHDYYWLSDRIYQTMDKWKIHLLIEKNQIIGSVFTMKQTEDSGEIFGCKVINEFRIKEVIAELFYKSCKAWMDEGLHTLLNFVPEGLESKSATLVGFKGYDTYMCYIKNEI